MPPSATITNGKKKKKEKCHAIPSTEQMSSSADNMEEISIDSDPKEVIEDIPTAPPRRNNTKQLMTPVSLSRERTISIAYDKGQIVRAVPITESTIAANVAELVQNVMPSNNAPPPSVVQDHRVEWVQMQTITKEGDTTRMADIVTLGKARGFHTWIANANGDMEEVISDRQLDVRFCLVLQCNFGKSNGSRIAMIVANAAHDKTNSLIVRSLKEDKVLYEEHFDSLVLDVQSSARYFVVVFAERFVVYDVSNFSKKGSVKCSGNDTQITPIALSDEMLAFGSRKLISECVSNGGMSRELDESPASYQSQFFSAAKALSRTVVSLGETVHGGNTRSKSDCKGIVNVVDANKLNESEEEAAMVQALCLHFMAHTDGVSYLKFSSDGRLLLTADVSATAFNVFLLLPHVSTTNLGAVQHLYRLHRGDTNAKVVSCAFSHDSRWCAIATNHGTCHVFALCPFGGRPTQRTHAHRFTNKESRFLRSSGLATVDSTSSFERHRNGSERNLREHPARTNVALARASGNSRIGPFPPPIMLTAIAKLRDQWSANNLAAWATDISPIALSTRRGNCEPRRMGLSFSSRNSRGALVACTLLIMRGDNLVEYDVVPVPTNSGNNDDAPKVDVLPRSMWTLQRTKNDTIISLPLQKGSPLIVWSTVDEGVKPPRDDWIPNVEVRTYSAPHRRLWMGPQFEMYHVESTDERAVLSACESHSSISSSKSIPVLVSSNAVPVAHNAHAHETRIECGSWPSDGSFLTSCGTDISTAILDAMKDISFENDGSANMNDEFFDTHSPGSSRRERGSPRTTYKSRNVQKHLIEDF